jgi:hypothetical protein
MVALIVGTIIFVSAGEVDATPNAAQWRRETLLGVSGDSYFVWVSSWGQGGSNHEYEESAALQRRLFADNTVVESNTLSSAMASDLDGPYEGSEGSMARVIHAPFDLSRYLREKEVSPVFAGDWLCDCVILDGALTLTDGDSTATVLSAEDLRLQVPALGRDPRVGGCWYVSNIRSPTPGDFWFYTVRYNTPSWDDDWSELLIVVPGHVVRGAAARLPQKR